MKNFPMVVAFIGLTAFCWGIYGPVLHVGQNLMEGSKLRPFIGVGLAYFAIAVVVPLVWLKIRGEAGHWTFSGTVWSLIAGAAGALGALGIVLAFAFRGKPIFVMPLVFGCAPVVNTFVTMFMTGTFKQVKPVFFVGLGLVIAGAATVLIFKPAGAHGSAGAPPKIEYEGEKVKITTYKHTEGGDVEQVTGPSTLDDIRTTHPAVYREYLNRAALRVGEIVLVTLSVMMTAICWGAYGPVLHKGQMKMQGSRLRPFICVGLAYFLIAVIVPLALLAPLQEPGEFTFEGMMYSLAGGAAGAVGALGIIMAFNFGGKPAYVMPLVFGGAPVVNTITTLASAGTLDQIQPVFIGGLIMAIAGAVIVLVFSPKAPHKAPVSAPHGEPVKQPA